MHRSASTTRVADEYYLAGGGGSGGGVKAGLSSSAAAGAVEMDRLPSYDPMSEAAKKEAGRMKFAENMVHLIPLVIILCAAVLWFFSHPDIEFPNNDDSIIARIKNMTIEGYSNWNGSSMTMGMEDLDPINQIGVVESGREFDNKEP